MEINLGVCYHFRVFKATGKDTDYQEGEFIEKKAEDGAQFLEATRGGKIPEAH